MARMNVNPTRMELTRIKRELSTATRGHKLLKDKQDEMIRQFMDLIRKNQKLRYEVENELLEVIDIFKEAKNESSYEGIIEALMVPSNKVSLEISKKSIMNVEVPELSYQSAKDINLTYSFAFTPSLLDSSVLKLANLLPKMVELARVEKATEMLAKEIEKTRRRVNAIEYVMIPNMEETIHFITMKLDDNERSNTIRLMKSKEIIVAKNNNEY